MVEKPVRTNGWGALRRWRLGPVPGIAVLATAVVAIVVAVFVVSGTTSGTPLGAGPSTTPIVNAADASQESISAYGDSVLEGAGPALRKTFREAGVSADVGIQASEVLRRVSAAHDAAKLQPIVLIHTGDNGVISESQLTAVLDKLRDRQRVLLATVYVGRPWQGDNLKLVRSMPGRYPNVRLADWNAYAAANKDLLYDDGIHMKPQGATAYAKLIVDAATTP